ncbi:Transcription initiation factor TFIID subunit 12 [Cytospora paraplurivora]|uniref:Transcription initiation factor TFIID subunit 12 n=1 Tax=Cytospora paraplurivora TaxID=2898453 RepID=A0AAN9YCX9_9PEZI
MNQGGQPSQVPQQGQPQNAAARVQMFRPEHMRNLPQLSPDERVKYENGLRALWTSMQGAPPGSPQQLEAHKKIVDFSQQLMLKMRQRGPGTQGQQTAQAGNEQSSGSTEATASAATAATPAVAAQPSPVPAPAAVPPPTAASSQAQPQQQPVRPAAVAVPPFVKQHMDQMTFIPPQNITDQGADAVAKWTAANKDRLQKALLQMHTTAEKMRNFDNFIRQKQQKGSPLTGEEQKTLQNIQAMKPQVMKAHQDAKTFVDNFRNDQTARKTAPVDAAKSQQQAGVGGFTCPHNTNGPGSASQPIKIEPGTQQHPPHLPPVNTAIASAAAAGLPSAGTPTQNRTPQIATPTLGGAPRSLSHQAALSLANQRGPGPQPGSISNQTPQQGTPQGQLGTPSSSAPPGVMGTAQPQNAGHPHAHPTQQPQALTQKLPIPKQLPEKAAAPPMPVPLTAGGVTPGRPTYTQGGGIAGGVMGNPVLAKLPVVQMEGEGERVLNQKKLNDLVRQVCGGQVEGQEGASALTPDVEESILNLADSFVDRLLHAACNNAKQRGSKVLEIRDIQLVLERTYNIRIPGYSSDELRTVRKIQPAQGWITKMSAIQAAKVMPGKGDL